jgi:uncharacterized protein GlcG (DUF336 family)
MFQRRVFSYAATLMVAVTLTISGLHGQPGQLNPDSNSNCSGLPNHVQLQRALAAAVAAEDSGLNNQMWATIVDRSGIVCAVAFSGGNTGAQWPGSRLISAQKANTANAFSLDRSSFSNGKGQPNGLALSTANLFTAVQPGGSLYGLQASNPVDTFVGYGGSSANYGQANDPMVGYKIGGVNVFGGGLALYAAGEALVGGVGVSGDTSCTDHDTAWRVRHNLGLDHLGSVAPVGTNNVQHPDNIIYDIEPNMDGTGATGQSPTGDGGIGQSASGFGHPKCINTGNPAALPAVQP